MLVTAPEDIGLSPRFAPPLIHRATTPAQPVLAVVGGGAVATSLLSQLAQRIAHDGRAAIGEVLVFSPEAQPGAGEAYQDDLATNLLNTQAAGLTVLHGRPNHFYRWALRHEPEWRARFPDVALEADAYLPRALFGQYLRDAFAQALAELQRLGVAVRHVRDSVAALQRAGTAYELHTAAGELHAADLVVLAVGNQESVRHEHLRHFPGYFARPYPSRDLARRIGPQQSVCILGSSLSAVDAAIALAGSGHRARITMVSHSGRLPRVHTGWRPAIRPLSRGEAEARLRARSGRLRLRELGTWVLEALANSGLRGHGIARALQAPHDTGPATPQNDQAWLSIVAYLNESIDLLWHHLGEEDRYLVQRDFLPQWLAYRTPFPEVNARKLQPLLDSGQLVLSRGRLDVAFDPEARLFDVSVVDRQSASASTVHAACVVNALGYTNDITRCRSPLLRSMLAEGLLRPDDFGGVQADFDTGEVLARDGSRLQGVYALGSLVSGTYFWTHSMAVNARLAGNVAHGLLARARKGVPCAGAAAGWPAPGMAWMRRLLPLHALNATEQP